jgi:hypothetical protein
VAGGDPVSYTLATTATQFSGVGSHAITVTLGTNPNYTVTATNSTLSISQRHVTGSFTASDKVYDGTTSASVLTRSLAGALGTDNVALNGGTASFANKNVGNSKTVTLSGAMLAGTDASNYALDSVATATANIAPLHITGSFTADNKSYDGNTAATVLTRSLSGSLGADTVSLTGGAATFANKNVGTAKVVTLSGAGLAGADAANYLLDSVATTTANITPKGTTPSVMAASKFYDGTTAATITNCSLAGIVSGDAVGCAAGLANFDTPAPGIGKTVTANSITHSGAQASNYQLLSSTATTTANIGYPTAGTCLGEPGHQILQPINADGTSVVKRNSTVPAKFRVCDAAGNSVGIPGVVQAFQLIAIVNGITSTAVNETVTSTTPDAAFRWDSTGKLWIFNINTKAMDLNRTYVYRITLNDGSFIDFQFGVK